MKVALYRLRFAGPPADNRIQLRNPVLYEFAGVVGGKRRDGRNDDEGFETSGRMRRMRGGGRGVEGKRGDPTRKTREKNKRKGATGEEGGCQS